MAQTPKLALPYPVATDPANGPAGFQSLATAVEASVVPGTVTSLPGSPYDGQVVNYLADATAGAVWRLRYRTTASGSYKWECVGGSPLVAEVNTQANLTGPTAGGAQIDIPGSVGPALTIPLAGEYEINYGGTIYHVSGTTPSGVVLGVARGAAPAVGGEEIYLQTVTGNALPAYRTKRLVATAGQVFTLRYYIGGATVIGFANRSLRALPVRVG